MTKSDKNVQENQNIRKLDSSNTDEVRYILRIVEEPEESPTGLTQKEFEMIINCGKRAHKNDKNKKNLIEFATLETVKGTKATYKGKAIKFKKVEKLFEKGLVSIIEKSIKTDSVNEKAEEVKQVKFQEILEREVLVEHVKNALLKAWFPNGHAGETQESMSEDWKSWQATAALDAKCAVEAVLKVYNDTTTNQF